MDKTATDSGLPADDLVCYCHRVSRRAIVQAIQSGARTLQDVQAATGAGHGDRCRELNPNGTCCSADIRRILAAEAPPRP